MNREQALQELENFFEVMDIDIKREDEEMSKKIQALIDYVVDAMQKGRCTFNENDEPVVIPWRPSELKGKELVIREPNGANLMAADGKTGLKAIYAVMAEITKVSPSSLAKLKAQEFDLLRAFYTFFTA